VIDTHYQVFSNGAVGLVLDVDGVKHSATFRPGDLPDEVMAVLREGQS
jgi:hypothetical protein